jgi:hypothetical protein
MKGVIAALAIIVSLISGSISILNVFKRVYLDS